MAGRDGFPSSTPLPRDQLQLTGQLHVFGLRRRSRASGIEDSSTDGRGSTEDPKRQSIHSMCGRNQSGPRTRRTRVVGHPTPPLKPTSWTTRKDVSRIYCFSHLLWLPSIVWEWPEEGITWDMEVGST